MPATDPWPILQEALEIDLYASQPGHDDVPAGLRGDADRQGDAGGEVGDRHHVLQDGSDYPGALDTRQQDVVGEAEAEDHNHVPAPRDAAVEAGEAGDCHHQRRHFDHHNQP